MKKSVLAFVVLVMSLCVCQAEKTVGSFSNSEYDMESLQKDQLILMSTTVDWAVKNFEIVVSSPLAMNVFDDASILKNVQWISHLSSKKSELKEFIDRVKKEAIEGKDKYMPLLLQQHSILTDLRTLQAKLGASPGSNASELMQEYKVLGDRMRKNGADMMVIEQQAKEWKSAKDAELTALEPELMKVVASLN